jgi:N2227-like protein
MSAIATAAATSTDPWLDTVLKADRQRHGLETIACCFADFRKWALDAKHLLWLLEAPQSGRARPRSSRVGINAHDFAAEPAAAGVSPLFRQRHHTVRAAIVEQARALVELLAPLEPEHVDWTDFTAFLESRKNQDPDLWSYFNHLHRDWGWDGEENERALQAVMSLIPTTARPRRVLVPGAGGCRLAYDLHRVLEPDATCVTDVQPLLFLCAARILAGKTVTLYEFPSQPLDLASCAVRRDLRAPAGPIQGHFHFVLTDVNDRWFKPASFECIVTSWFIDAIPVDMHHLFALINELLVEGGLWVNVGPTMFAGSPTRVYSLEEVLEAVPYAGFALGKSFQRRQPYMASPASTSRRLERVLGFRATKIRGVAVPDPPTAREVILPVWLSDNSQPVSLDKDVSEFIMAHHATAEVLLGASAGLSISQIADCVAAKFGLSQEQAKVHAERTLKALTAM